MEAQKCKKQQRAPDKIRAGHQCNKNTQMSRQRPQKSPMAAGVHRPETAAVIGLGIGSWPSSAFLIHTWPPSEGHGRGRAVSYHTAVGVYFQVSCTADYPLPKEQIT